MKKIILVALILLFWLRGLTANKYISAVGNDANAGTISSPWRTIQKLNSIFTTLLPGDSVLFRKGDTFYGSITILKSGTLGARIVISSYGSGNLPIITGLSPVTNWVSIGGNKWESSAIATLPSYLNTVVQSERLVAVGRYPNLSAPNLGYLTISSHVGATQMTVNSLLNTPNFTGAWSVVRYGSVIQYRQVSSHVGTQLNFTTPFTFDFENGYGTFFINSPLTLDSTSEWYYNPVTKKISWYSVSAPTGVEAATITSTLSSTNFSNITIDNIHFKGSNGSNVVFNGGANNIVQNCKVELSGISGIEFNNSTNGSIINDSVYYTQNEAIRVTGTGGVSFLIANNTIYSAGVISGMAEDQGGTGRMNGIAIQGSGTVLNPVMIRNNEVKRTGYGGIRWDGNNNTIKENFVDSFCLVKGDGGGLYTVGVGGTATNNKIIKNIVLHGIGVPQGTSVAAQQSFGIYMDNNASNMLIDSNSIAYTEIDIFLHGGHNNVVTNNTTYSYKYGFHAWQYDPTDLVRDIRITNNIFGVTTATTIPSFLRSTTSDIGSFGIIDSNYYVRPLTTNALLIRNQATNVSLPMWRSSFPAYDAQSALSPAYVTNPSQIQFLYNKTSAATVTPLNGGWKDARNVSYSGSITLQPYTSALLISTGSLITPTITWANPLPTITYGTTLAGLLNASTGVAGMYVYTRGGVVVSAATVLTGGTHTLDVLFTPTDGATYTTATKSVSITVNKAAAALSYSAPTLTQTWTGLPLAPTVITTPAGLPYNITYNNVGATPIDTGTYVIRAAVNSPNYQSPVVVGSFRINPAPATITVSNIVQQYDSTLKQVSVVTNPVGLAYTITSPKRYKGTYAVQVVLNDPNHTATTVNTTLTITAGTTTLAWTPASPLTHPTATGSGQTNATSPKSGVYVYIPPSGTVLTAGTQPLKVDFTPSDTNLAPIIGTVRDIVVNKGTTSITVTDTIQFADGNPKFITAIAGQTSGTVTVNYTGAHTAVGDYPFSVTYTDANWQATTVSGTLHIISNAANIFITNFANRTYIGSPISPTVTTPYSYTITFNGSATVPTVVGSYTTIATINDGIHTGADTVTMTIIKATPATTWPAITAKTYPFTLSGTELNLTSPVAGAATYNPLNGTALSVGTHVLTGTWTPSDLSNYNVVTVTNTVTVNKGVATISASNFNQDYDATAKSVTVITTPANLNVIVLYDGSSTLPITAGNKTVNITLADSNYIATPVNGTLVINKINAVLTYVPPAPIPVNTALTDLQLNATSNIAGTFTYVPALGSVPPAGTSFITATFHPTDSVNYNTTSISVPLSVYGNSISSLTYYYRDGHIIYINTP